MWLHCYTKSTYLDALKTGVGNLHSFELISKSSGVLKTCQTHIALIYFGLLDILLYFHCFAVISLFIHNSTTNIKFWISIFSTSPVSSKESLPHFHVLSLSMIMRKNKNKENYTSPYLKKPIEAEIPISISVLRFT